MKIEVRERPFNPYREIEQYQELLARGGQYGATTCFVGTMRDVNDARRVYGMTLEYYPGMTEKHITRICRRASAQWSLLDCLVLHRVGKIEINDTIVVVAAWAVHRGDAMEACRFIVEDLKSRAPFWKKEKLGDGEAWVEGNTSGFSN